MTTAPFARSAGFTAIDTAARLAQLRKPAWLLDAQFGLPGSRFYFGVNSLFGLIPVSGNMLLGLVSLYIVNEARVLGAPPSLLGQMPKIVSV